MFRYTILVAYWDYFHHFSSQCRVTVVAMILKKCTNISTKRHSITYLLHLILPSLLENILIGKFVRLTFACLLCPTDFSWLVNAIFPMVQILNDLLHQAQRAHFGSFGSEQHQGKKSLYLSEYLTDMTDLVSAISLIFHLNTSQS